MYMRRPTQGFWLARVKEQMSPIRRYEEEMARCVTRFSSINFHHGGSYLV